MSKNLPKIMLISSMLIFGTIGLFRRYIPIGSATLATARGFIGIITLLVIMACFKKKISFSAIKENFALLALSGICLGVNWILLFEAYNYTSVAVATLCYYMAPIFVILMSPFFFNEKITATKAISVILALVGMVFVSGVLNGGVSSLKGMMFGVGAAALYATVTVINKKMTAISAFDKTIVQLGVTAVVMLPYAFLTESIQSVTFSPYLIIMVAIMGVLHTGITYGLYFASISKLPAQTAAMFSYIDPIVAILISAFVLSEKIGVLEIVGIFCVFGATIISELPKKAETTK